MKKIILALLPALVLLSSCSITCVEGIGEIEIIELDLDVFEGIVQESAVPVSIGFGLNQKVEVEGQRNLIDLMSREVQRGNWTLSFSEHVCADDLSVRITLPLLKEVSVYGSGDITGTTPFRSERFKLEQKGSGKVSLDLNTDKLEVEMHGSGDISLSGLVEQMKVDLEGSGDLLAYDLEAKIAEISSDGSGDTKVLVKEELKMELNGSGNIYYKGNPSDLEMSRSGSGEAKAE